MENIHIHTLRKQLPGDMITPVHFYKKIRDEFPRSALLESNNFSNVKECHSIIGFDPIASIRASNDRLYFDAKGIKETMAIDGPNTLADEMSALLSRVKIDNEQNQNDFVGFFGHFNFECCRYFDKINILQKEQKELPELQYFLYRYIAVFNHYEDTITITECIPAGEHSKLSNVLALLQKPSFHKGSFSLHGQEKANMNDQQFKDLVTKGKASCQYGDVFQIVYSRQFSQSYRGDDFELYRALRTVNPSPYLYYFDFGSYRIIGSSPESQLIIEDGKATVHPIAGTFKRSGNEALDQKMAESLLHDPKENAEHTMLVDLARNDLGRNGKNVEVTELKTIKYYSHVIHMVSEVRADIPATNNTFKVLGDTFPAGTLSGAPKIKAIELINQNEPTPRMSYGGGLGFLKLDGSLNHAIVIRSFLSSNNTLYYQAGAGVTINSDEEKECEEVNNKLAALRKAIQVCLKRMEL